MKAKSKKQTQKILLEGQNKKILNAQNVIYNEIPFKSKIEVLVYKTLCEAGFSPEYEKVKFTLWKGYKPTVAFYNRHPRTKMLMLDKSKLRDITYTPDFTFYYEGYFIIIEAKGIENDVFPLKKKMFRQLLESFPAPCIYFEVYTKKNTLQAIEIIKNLKKQKQ